VKIINVKHPYQINQLPNEDCVLVLGFFDGIHLGHQKVIQEGYQIAKLKGLKLALMTFKQHPSVVFKNIPADEVKYLASLKQKERLLADLGVDYLFEIDFTKEFASLAPQKFVDEYLVGFKAKVVVTGFDYTYGPKEIADVAHLPQYAHERFEIVTVPKKELRGEKISSTRIRKQLAKGNMEEIEELLGRPYEIEGTVVHGEARGRTLGYPTANVEVPGSTHLPRVGVYTCRILVRGQWYDGMASIGHNDTFGPGRKLTIEVNILDFDQDIYGEWVQVQWCHFIRPMVKFSGLAEIIEQLAKDKADTMEYFKEKIS
jgi:riboflavin kinase/FMN adenylyltransferase